MSRRAIVGVAAVVLTATVVLEASRVDDVARFVTWPVVGFTALAAVVAVSSLRVAMARPITLAIGLLPGLVLAYFLSAAPLAALALVLIFLGILALQARDVAAGMATAAALAMVVLVVVQAPAVECRSSGVSTNSGPFWLPSTGSSSGSGTAAGGPDGQFLGETEVGEHRYGYRCEDGRLNRFERID